MSDVDRTKSFYESLGRRLDADFADGADYRVVQLTPRGRHAPSSSVPTSPLPRRAAEGPHLIVPDIEATTKDDP